MLGKILARREFVRNTILLITGAGLSQLIPLIFSPVLTRIFTPADFGRLAFFMAVCAILSIVATGFYELSIMLPKRDVGALNILGLIVGLSASVSTVLFLVLLFCGELIIRALNVPVTYGYLLLLPIGIFFSGCFQGLSYWLNRKKQYRIINYCRVWQSVITVATSVLMGYVGFKANGLIIGFLAGITVSTLPLFLIMYRRRNLIRGSMMIEFAKKYRNYPGLMMPTGIMNTVATQTPVFFITRFFSAGVVGSYSFASRILTAPVGIISGAIGQVYFQKMAEAAKEGSSSLFRKLLVTALFLTLGSVAIFIPFIIWGEEIFGFAFGDDWRLAGTYVQVLAVAVLIKFIVSPISTIFHVTNNLYAVSLWQGIYLCSTITIFYVFRNTEFASVLVIYAIHEVFLYALYFLLMIKASRQHDRRIILNKTVSNF